MAEGGRLLGGSDLVPDFLLCHVADHVDVSTVTELALQGVGMGAAEFEKFKANFKRPVRRTREVLLTWNKRQGVATLRTLVAALHDWVTRGFVDADVWETLSEHVTPELLPVAEASPEPPGAELTSVVPASSQEVRPPAPTSAEAASLGLEATKEVGDFTVLVSRELGRGTFGVVFKAQHKETGDAAAAKKTAALVGGTSTNTTAFKELLNYQRLPTDHPNIVKVLDTLYHYSEQALWIFMEFCTLGDMNVFCRNQQISEDVKLDFMQQISAALVFLHHKGIIHRDVKPANILLTDDPLRAVPRVKVTDFGLSKFLEDEGTSLMTSHVGTAPFMAPEFWRRDDQGKVSYRRSVDIFATGLVFLCLLQSRAGHNLRPTAEDASVTATEEEQVIGLTMHNRRAYSQTEVQVAVLRSTDSATARRVKELVLEMVRVEPGDRPSAEYVHHTLDLMTQNRELDVVYERNPDETSAAAAASEPSDSVVMGSKRLEMAYMDWDWAYCIHTVPESHSLYAAREEEILMFNLKNKEVTKGWPTEIPHPRGLTVISLDGEETLVVAYTDFFEDPKRSKIVIRPTNYKPSEDDEAVTETWARLTSIFTRPADDYPWEVAWSCEEDEVGYGNSLVALPDSRVAVGVDKSRELGGGPDYKFCVVVLSAAQKQFTQLQQIETGAQALFGLCVSGDGSVVCATQFDLCALSLTSGTRLWTVTAEELQGESADRVSVWSVCSSPGARHVLVADYTGHRVFSVTSSGETQGVVLSGEENGVFLPSQICWHETPSCSQLVVFHHRHRDFSDKALMFSVWNIALKTSRPRAVEPQ